MFESKAYIAYYKPMGDLPYISFEQGGLIIQGPVGVDPVDVGPVGVGPVVVGGWPGSVQVVVGGQGPGCLGQEPGWLGQRPGWLGPVVVGGQVVARPARGGGVT